MLSHTQIERRTRTLLRKAEVFHPPVNVHRLAKRLGIVVKEEPSDSKISGALFKKGPSVIIGVNASHPKNRKRFTIAHELGHLFLHDDEIQVDHHYAIVNEEQLRIRASALRSRVSSEAKDPREIEANRFAAALLMPAAFLETSLRDASFPVGTTGIAQLARGYGVSVQAMMFRLMNLGVPVDPID